MPEEEEPIEEEKKEEEVPEPLKVEEPKPLEIPPPERIKTSILDDDLGILDTDKSRVRVYRSSVQSIPDATDTKVQFNAENWDDNNEFDSTTNYRFTAQKSGYYLIQSIIGIADPSSGKTIVTYIRKNGATIAQRNITTSAVGMQFCPISDIVYLNVNDYIEIWIYHNYGTAQNTTSSSPVAYLNIIGLKIESLKKTEWISGQAIPAGVIVMWSGALANIPTGWQLCDGTNGTPDLRAKFIYGTAAAEEPGGTGGSSSHSHTSPIVTVTPAVGVAVDSSAGTPVATAGSGVKIGRPITGTGANWIYAGTDTQAHLPPYYKLAYIMKL